MEETAARLYKYEEEKDERGYEVLIKDCKSGRA